MDKDEIEAISTRELIERREDKQKCVNRFTNQMILLNNIILEGEKIGYEKSLIYNVERVKKSLQNNEWALSIYKREINKRVDGL